MKIFPDLSVSSRPHRPRSALPQPALRLDFVAAAYHPGGFGATITFSRSGTARYHDATGAMQTAAVDAPRIDHDPATGARRGFLIEDARTNLFLNSATFGGPGGGLNADLLTSAVAAPITAQTMMVLRENSASGNHQISFAHTLGAGLHALSAYFKAGARTKMRYVITGATLGTLIIAADLAAGTVAVVSGTGAAQIVNCGGGIYRVIAIFTAAASESVTSRIRLCDAAGLDAYAGDGTSGYYLWGGQLEAGDCVSSYIPTAGSSVTRAADVPFLALGPWWTSAAEGTLFAEFDCPPVSQRAAAAYFNTTSISDAIALTKANAANSAAGTYLVGSMHDGAEALSVPLDAGLTPGLHRAAITWGGGTMRAAANGVLGAQVTQRNPVPTKLSLGQREGTLHINGCLRKIAYYPRRLADAQLLSLVP